MKVDQTQILDSLKNRNVAPNSQGIEAYMASKGEETEKVGFGGAFVMDQKAKVSEKGLIQGSQLTYGKPNQEKEERGMKEQLEEAGMMDAMTKHNQMAVLANTASPEDLKEMAEEGYAFSSTDSATLVTVVDKIKINMAKTGADVDLSDLDAKTVEEACNSKALARQIEAKLEEADLPTTKQNQSEVMNVMEELSTMKEMPEETMKYLLAKGLEPTIDNVYMANHSSVGLVTVSKEDAANLYADMDKQIEAFLKENGLSITEENIKDSKWLIANDIPLTGENVDKVQQLTAIGIQFKEDGGVDFKAAMKTILQTISQGKRPGQTKLSAITEERKREESRLQMTADSNLSRAASRNEKRLDLVDLEPIENHVNELKAKEQVHYESILKQKLGVASLTSEGSSLIKEKAELMVETETALSELKQAPSYVVKDIAFASFEERQAMNLTTIKESGAKLAEDLKKAGESYESLMTSPRKDMGDSIQKAFRNVDDILEDLGYEKNDMNRRAVRILAYNEIDITRDAVDKVKEADMQMQRTFKSMTSAVTLEMIRRGENPLNMNLDELNQKAEAIAEEMGLEDERFSKFLWKLEQKHEITEDERESFMGVYRLITQVEKTDGAALGALLQQGGDLTMKNLLTAVRNKKKSGMDYTIDDNFDGVDGNRKTQAIDLQINRAFMFQKHCLNEIKDGLNESTARAFQSMDWENMTPEEIKEGLAETFEETEVDDLAYEKAQLESFREMVDKPEEIYRMLESLDMQTNAVNLMAASEMLRNPNSMFDTLFNKKRNTRSNIELVQDMKNQVLEEFGEALEHPEELAEAEEKLAKVAENVMKTMIADEEHITSLDIRELQKMCQQFTLAAKKTTEESFVIPIETTDGVGAVNLKVVRGSDDKGWVDLLFQGSVMGKLNASFHAKEKQVSGMIAVDNEETRRLISDNLGMIAGIFQEKQEEAIDISVAYVPDMDYEKAVRNHFFEEDTNKQKAKADNGKENEVQTKRLYAIAESFIQVLQELNDNGSFGLF